MPFREVRYETGHDVHMLATNEVYTLELQF